MTDHNIRAYLNSVFCNRLRAVATKSLKAKGDLEPAKDEIDCEEIEIIHRLVDNLFVDFKDIEKVIK